MCNPIPIVRSGWILRHALTSEDIFRTVVSIAVDNNSVHSVSKQYQDVACETSLWYHLKKLNMEELIKSNEKILLQELIKTLKTGKSYEFAIDLTDDPITEKQILLMRNM